MLRRVTENLCDSAVESCATRGTDDGKSTIIRHIYPADVDVIPARVFIAVIVGFTTLAVFERHVNGIDGELVTDAPARNELRRDGEPDWPSDISTSI